MAACVCFGKGLWRLFFAARTSGWAHFETWLRQGRSPIIFLAYKVPTPGGKRQREMDNELFQRNTFFNSILKLFETTNFEITYMSKATTLILEAKD